MSPIPWRCKHHASSQPESSRLASLRAELDRLFDRYVRGSIGGLDWMFGREPGAPIAPPADVYHDRDQVVVRMELPGVDPSAVEVTLCGEELSVSGERPAPADAAGMDCVQQELWHGPFRRSVALASRVDPESVDARMADGVLVVRLRKAAPAAPTRVVISGASAGGSPEGPPP